jgi:hypothetical protein
VENVYAETGSAKRAGTGLWLAGVCERPVLLITQGRSEQACDEDGGDSRREHPAGHAPERIRQI